MSARAADGEEMVTFQIARRLLSVESARPSMVSQATCAAVFGLTKAAYLDLYRAGAFAAARVGHLRVAAYEDVRDALVGGARVHAVKSRAPAANDTTDDLLAQLRGGRARAR